METHPNWHGDALGRVRVINEENQHFNHFLRPDSGRIAILVVQTIGSINDQSKWIQVPLIVRTRPLSRLLTWGWPEMKSNNITITLVLEMAAKWLISCFFMLLVGYPSFQMMCRMLTSEKLVIPINFESEIRNGGYYDSIKHRD